ncbi:MAG: DUF6261 family protein [Tannerellaceae bacterium]|jgi:hypothetical protein|nr:DUF6261 family protein [Tannerellaceae bacterium]
MKITRINQPNLHNEEWFGFYTDFRNMVEKYGVNALNINDLFNLFLPLHNKADNLLLVLRKSIYTEEMKVADKERSTLFNSLYKIVNGMVNQPNVAKKEAAKRLFNLLRQYRQYGVKGSYIEESSGIYNLLQDMEGKYSADITLLFLDEWISALRQVEERFIALRAQRIQESIEKPKESLQEIRAQVDRLYSGIVSILDVRLLADGLGGDIVVEPDELDTNSRTDDDPTPPELRGNIVYNFVVAWNIVVKGYHNLLAMRAGRSAKKKQVDTPTPESPAEPLLSLLPPAL